MSIYNPQGALPPDVIEVLYELGNMGAATAVMPIGNLRKIEIHLEVPQVVTIQGDMMSELDYKKGQVVIGVTTCLEENMQGELLFLLDRAFVLNTVFKMTGEMYAPDDILASEDCNSAVQEIINYMTAGYAKVIGGFMDMPVYIKAKSISMDKIENIVKDVANVKKAACVKTKFTLVDEQNNKTNESGQVIIFPDERSIERFLEIMDE